MRTLLFLTLSTLLSLSAYAQQKISASVDRNKLGLNEQVTYTIDVSNTNSRDITRPAFKDFKVIAGPIQSSQTTIINGQITTKSTISFRLKPSRIGTLTIEAATLIENGTSFKANPITITVSKSAQSNDTNLLGRLTLNKRKVYEGEQVIATYAIYNRYNTIEVNDYELPSQTGFAVEDIEINSVSWDPTLKTYDGMKYQVAVLKREVIFPQVYGDLELQPFSFTGFVGRWAFNYGKEFDITSNTPDLEVLPLPDGEPVDFTGGVGEFELDIDVDSTHLKVNDAITLVATISGKGNLQLIDAPVLDFPPEFEVYDPKTANELKATSSGLKGNRSFEFLVIPRHPGEYHIPPYSFSYFDPKAEKYITVTSDTIHFTIDRGAMSAVDSANGSAPTEVEAQEVTALDSDIRFIKTSADIHPKEPSQLGSLNWWLIIGVPGILFLFLFVAMRRKPKEKQEDPEITVAKVNKRQASKTANRHLGEAKKHLRSGDEKAFYESIFKGMYGYLSEKMQIPMANINKATISTALHSKGVDTAQIDQLIGLLDQCEMARFAPSFDVPSEQVMENATAMVNNLESSLR